MWFLKSALHPLTSLAWVVLCYWLMDSPELVALHSVAYMRLKEMGKLPARGFQNVLPFSPRSGHRLYDFQHVLTMKTACRLQNMTR